MQNQLTTPISTVAPPTVSSVTPSSFISSSVSDHTKTHHKPPELTTLQTIYHENRLKVLNTKTTLFGNNTIGGLIVSPANIYIC